MLLQKKGHTIKWYITFAAFQNFGKVMAAAEIIEWLVFQTFYRHYFVTKFGATSFLPVSKDFYAFIFWYLVCNKYFLMIV